MTSQHWFKKWLGAVSQHVIAWTNVDPVFWPLMTSLSYNVFKWDDPYSVIIVVHLTDVSVCSLCLSGLRGGYNTSINQIIMCEEQFEANPVILNCPVGSFVNLTYVNYGRTQHYSEVCHCDCGSSRTNCPPTAAVTEVAQRICQGQQTCQLTFTGLSPGDTCPDTYKYFDVRYNCIKPGNRRHVWPRDGRF